MVKQRSGRTSRTIMVEALAYPFAALELKVHMDVQQVHQPMNKKDSHQGYASAQ